MSVGNLRSLKAAKARKEIAQGVRRKLRFDLVPFTNWNEVIITLLKKNLRFYPFPDTEPFKKLSPKKQAEALEYFKSEALRIEWLRRRYFNEDEG